ncbi:MAG: phytanoyl-CoA dioxygenase family protein [Bacteroidia bacterium]|nr:phytanoyl-CoA dioxygenase family protein [Bacteroidia bacterium]
MAVRIFKNSEHQALFDKQGFIVLPFLTTSEIQDLEAFFDQTHPNLHNNGFFSDSYHPDYNYKKLASEKIVHVFSRAYESYFTNYTPFGGAFLYKTPGQQSELAAHQDWTIVDETQQVALNCWVPLCDINETNGSLMILPGSHFQNYPSLRCPTLPFFFSGHEDIIHQNLIPFHVKAGTAIILNQSVIHYSLPNRSNAVRKAITAGIKSFGAQMYFHYKVPDLDLLEIFKEEDSFLIQFENFATDIMERPKLGEKVGEKPYTSPRFTKSEINSLIQSMRLKAGFDFVPLPPTQAPASNLFSRLKNWIAR